MRWVTTSTILTDLKQWENESAWTRFAGRFREPLHRFARASGVEANAADDVVQETLLRFARAYRDGRYDARKGRLSKWLFGIAWRQILKHRTKDARPSRAPALAPDIDRVLHVIPDEKSASDVWDREWRRFVVRACIERVRAEFRPETMHIFEQLVVTPEPSEAARVLGISVKAVYNAKHRVLTRIREVRPEIEGTV